MGPRSGNGRIGDGQPDLRDRKLVFWDIDGVLNHPGCWGNFPRDRALDPVLVNRARQLVEDLDALCVLSSSWRLGIGYVETILALRRVGWTDVRRRFLGATPSLAGAQRGTEVRQWLKDRGLAEATQPFVVVDDCSDMLGVQHRFVQTRGSVGLTDDDCTKIKALFSDALVAKRPTAPDF